MSKLYYFYFGNGVPATYTGLSPTFIVFNIAGTTATPPGVTEFVNSGATGIYGFTYGSTANPAFVIDGGATITTASIRYIVGAIDPVMTVDQTIGYSTDSFGNTTTDPSTLWGMSKRGQEFNEGDKTLTKSSGVWQISSRGSSTLLRQKTVANTTSNATTTGS